MSDNVFRPHQNNQNDNLDLPPNHPLSNAPIQSDSTSSTAPKITGKIPPELARKLSQSNNQPTNSLPPSQPEEDYGFSAADNPLQAEAVRRAMLENGGLPKASISSALNSILESLKQQSGQFEEVLLPSEGRFYDGTDGPTNGKIHIRPMTGEEEQILATPRFVKKGTALNMIFSRCIKENIKVDSLLTADRTFLLIYLRGISYGTEYEVEVKDPDSDRKFSTIIDLDSLPVTICPSDYGPVLTDVLPKSGLKLFYRLSRGKDETELQEHRERKLRLSGDSATDDTLMFRTSQLIESVEGITNKNEISLIVKNLPIVDLSYIRGLVNDPPFGVDTKVTILSPLSNEEFEIELPLEANFFFPRNRKKEKTQA